ncbi:hypothetical protein CEG15_13150 [Vibrio anguillarum]|nr:MULTISPECIES: hypothetical protein [Vibrio]ASG01068.1 hypothetical protein CEG15_13150 [Vibrio anguillarum]
MNENLDELLPTLIEFNLENVSFTVVDPSLLPEKTLKSFNIFMSGSTVPHRTYVYSHDYARFCMLVRRGDILIE